jgi:hypothetical protein
VAEITELYIYYSSTFLRKYYFQYLVNSVLQIGNQSAHIDINYDEKELQISIEKS